MCMVVVVLCVWWCDGCDDVYNGVGVLVVVVCVWWCVCNDDGGVDVYGGWCMVVVGVVVMSVVVWWSVCMVVAVMMMMVTLTQPLYVTTYLLCAGVYGGVGGGGSGSKLCVYVQVPGSAGSW